MYSHIVKGYNVGHTLTRRLGRFIFGLPGMFVDYCIVAPLWHDYSAYWNEAYIDYLDGVRVGVCQGPYRIYW